MLEIDNTYLALYLKMREIILNDNLASYEARAKLIDIVNEFESLKLVDKSV